MVLSISEKLQQNTVSEITMHILYIMQIMHIMHIMYLMIKDLLVQNCFVHFKPKMILNFPGLARNIENFGLEMSSSVHEHLAPDLERAGQHKTFEEKSKCRKRKLHLDFEEKSKCSI